MKLLKRTKIIQLKSKDVAALREKILKEQEGVCLICKKVPQRPCLDHEHKKRIKGSGKIRGVLCSSCNIFIAKSENSAIRYNIKIKDLPTILRRTADYFEKEQYPYLHPSEAPKKKKLKKTSYKKLVKKLKENKYKKKIPEYPKSELLIKSLKKLYKEMNLKPEFYK